MYRFGKTSDDQKKENFADISLHPKDFKTIHINRYNGSLILVSVYPCLSYDYVEIQSMDISENIFYALISMNDLKNNFDFVGVL